MVEQLGIQTPVVLDHCSKRRFFEKPYEVTIGEWSEWKGGSYQLTKQALVWFMDGSKIEKGLEPWRGDKVVDAKWSAVSTFTPPFTRLRLGPLRSVPKLCWRETAGESLL